MRAPGNVDTCTRMIQQHQETNGLPPTLEALGTSVWRSMVRKTSLLAAVTGAGGLQRQQGAAPEEVAEAADEADSAEAFAAEAAAGEVAEAAAPEHTAAETGKKPKKKPKKKLETNADGDVEAEEETEAEEADSGARQSRRRS